MELNPATGEVKMKTQTEVVPVKMIHMKESHNWSYDDIDDMREWLKDCVWANVEPEDFNALSDVAVIKGIQKYYVGGTDQFLKDGGR